MNVALLLLLAAFPDQQAVRHYERTRFDKIEPTDEASRKVVEFILRKEHWIGAFSDIADRFARYPDDLELSVDFNLDGEEAARTTGRGVRWKISFNLKLLAGAQKQLDEIEELKKAGKKVTFKVPPVKFDRLIHHEMTHVLQAGFDGPGWFVEGMAQLVGDDPNSLYQFAHDGGAVKALDTAPSSRTETYARGHLFWKWLDSRGATAKTFELAFVRRLGWKEALEGATGRSWASMAADESEWSAKELARLK